HRPPSNVITHAISPSQLRIHVQLFSHYEKRCAAREFEPRLRAFEPPYIYQLGYRRVGASRTSVGWLAAMTWPVRRPSLMKHAQPARLDHGQPARPHAAPR